MHFSVDQVASCTERFRFERAGLVVFYLSYAVMEDDKMDQFQKERDVLQNAAVLKKEGNAAYAEKDYRKAVGKYHRALLLLKSVGLEPADSVLFGKEKTSESKFPEELMTERKHLMSDCYNNLAGI
jgi:hypothetical protein